MNTRPIKQSFSTLKWHTLIVVLICYLPHILTEPAWLFIFFAIAMSYRITADYFIYPALPKWVRFVLFIFGCLLLWYGGQIFSVGFFIRCLLTFIILKCLEINNIRDIKVLILCNFFLIFSALIVIEELWIIIYLLIGVIANLSMMLELNSSQVSLRQIGSKSSQQLLLAFPLTILLFYVFPRIEPLWNVPTIPRASTGFSDNMSPGSISVLFNDESAAMQIILKKPVLNGYWRGVVLSAYDGEDWKPSWFRDSTFFPLPELKADEVADFDIILEPNQKRWLFYSGNPVAAQSSLLFSSSHGLIRQNRQPIRDRFAYSLKVAPAPYRDLNQNEMTENTRLPKNLDPRLTTWAKQQFASSHDEIKTFIHFLHDYIHHQAFWYTLTPPPLDADNNQMDTFWFETQKGFCEHYASAVAFIMRAVGIPARVILGYQGGQWNPITSAITLQQSDAHAWVEYWQKGIGWQELDPTTFIATERIDQTIRNREIYLNQEDNFNVSEITWGRKARFYLESLRFFSERWFLYYSQNTQQNLLQNVGLGQWKKGRLLQASLGFMVLFFVLLGFGYRWWQRRAVDHLLREYHLLQNEFRRFNIVTDPAATLGRQCHSLINRLPELEPVVAEFIRRYEQLRLRGASVDTIDNRLETIILIKKFRVNLRSKKS